MSSENSSQNRFERLEQALEAFQENARQLAVIAADFGPDSQSTLNQKLHTLVTGLQEVSVAASSSPVAGASLHDVHVPLELLDMLDQGRNPHMYTRDVIERTLDKNEQVNGKIELLKKFRSVLLSELAEETPRDAALYRSIRVWDCPQGAAQRERGRARRRRGECRPAAAHQCALLIAALLLP